MKRIGFKIFIPYGEPIEFLYKDLKYYPNISKNYSSKNSKKYWYFVLMGLAIFIVPKGELRLKIVRWKKKVQRHIDDQPYTDHPPHLTIIHSNIEEHQIAIQEIKNVYASLNHLI